MHRLLLYLQFFACLADADYGKDSHQESQNRRHRVKVRIGNENSGGTVCTADNSGISVEPLQGELLIQEYSETTQ